MALAGRWRRPCRLCASKHSGARRLRECRFFKSRISAAPRYLLGLPLAAYDVMDVDGEKMEGDKRAGSPDHSGVHFFSYEIDGCWYGGWFRIEGGRLEVSSQGECRAVRYDPSDSDASTQLLRRVLTEIVQNSDAPDVAGRRHRQELLSASLCSSSSTLIFRADSAIEREHQCPTEGTLGATPTKPTALEASEAGGASPLVHIEESQAKVADEAGLAELLASIPIPLSVRPLLRRSFFGRKWNPARQLDSWFGSDGSTVVCLKISGASAAVAMRMRMRFDDLRSVSPGLQPSLKALHRLLEGIAREDGKVPTAAHDARSRLRVILVIPAEKV